MATASTMLLRQRAMGLPKPVDNLDPPPIFYQMGRPFKENDVERQPSLSSHGFLGSPEHY